MANTFDKDPDAVLPYYVIWYVWLESGDTLSSHTVAADAGITVDSSAINSGAVTVDGIEYPANTVVTVWLSGGTALSNYTVTNHVVTANAQEEDHSFIVQMRER